MPRSEWWISPGGGRCRTIAMVSASNAISVCSVSRIDQPTIFAGMQIQYGGEVKPAFTGGDVGQVGEPNLAGSIGDKVPAEPVGCDRVGVPTIRCSRPSRQGRQTA